MIFYSCGLKEKDGKETFTTFPVLLAAIFSEKVSFASTPAHFSILAQDARDCLHLRPRTRFRFHSAQQHKKQKATLLSSPDNQSIMQSSSPKPSGSSSTHSTSSSILPPSLLPAAASRSAVYGNNATQSNSENLPPRTLARVARDVRDLVSKPPEGVRLVVDGETGMPNSLSEILVSREILNCHALSYGEE